VGARRRGRVGRVRLLVGAHAAGGGEQQGPEEDGPDDRERRSPGHLAIDSATGARGEPLAPHFGGARLACVLLKRHRGVVTDLAPFRLSSRVARELGFAAVQAILESRCATPFGREALAREVFPPTREAVEARVSEVTEAAHLVAQRSLPDFPALKDLRPALELV